MKISKQCGIIGNYPNCLYWVGGAVMLRCKWFGFYWIKKKKFGVKRLSVMHGIKRDQETFKDLTDKRSNATREGDER